MRASHNTSFDVVIAGAGPVGLLLACELRLAGCAVLVLERAPDPRSPLKLLPFGLRGLSVATIESFDRRDLRNALADRIDAQQTSAAAHWTGQRRRPGGHFAGIQFFRDSIDDDAWPYRLPGPVGSMAADMASIEAVLATRADALGVVVRRGCAVERFDQTDDEVTVHVSDATMRCRWLVGCDGGRSAVRKAAGIGFVGTDPQFTGYSVQATLADPAMLRPGRHYTSTGMYTYAAPGTIAMVDFDGGARHRAAPDRAQIETVLRRISGADVTLASLDLATTWTDRACQATTYRCGRVMLAGDAAHVHSPLGGQGLNLGLGDAMNLGWKLAATIRGDAPDDLLDSYDRERRPVGAQVLDWSRAQVALMRLDAGSRALADIVRDLIETRDGATYFAERLWGIRLRYAIGDRHPLVGRSVPNLALRDGGDVDRRSRNGRGLLLEFGADPVLEPLAARWSGRIDHAAACATDRLAIGAALIRPDGIVAWACEAAPDAAEAACAASRWFGAPADIA